MSLDHSLWQVMISKAQTINIWLLSTSSKHASLPSPATPPPAQIPCELQASGHVCSYTFNLSVRCAFVSMCFRTGHGLSWAWFLLPTWKYSSMWYPVQTSLQDGESFTSMEDLDLWIKGLQNGVPRYYPLAKTVSWQPTSTHRLEPEVKTGNSSWSPAEHGPKATDAPGIRFLHLSPLRPEQALSSPCRTCSELPTG